MEIDIFHLFLFVIPGFITVWSFRYFTNSKKNKDFEYFALSVFWGLIMLLIYELVGTKKQIEALIGNPYSAALVLSILGLTIGLMGSKVLQLSGFKNAKNTKLLELILLIGIFLLTWISGYVSNFGGYYILFGIFCLLIAVCFHIKREKLQAHIEGDGVGKITVNETEPKNPQKGDLWIDTNKK